MQWNLNRNLNIFFQENAIENVVWKMEAMLSRPQCVNVMTKTMDEVNNCSSILICINENINFMIYHSILFCVICGWVIHLLGSWGGADRHQAIICIRDKQFSHIFVPSFVRCVHVSPGIILCMCPVNGRRRYNVMSSLIGWTHTQNDPWGEIRS